MKKDMKRLKYLGYSIALQEVPDEVALVINISGCEHRCEGCHSSYLWEYKGHYISDDIAGILYGNFDYITAVCFMGGEQNKKEMINLLSLCHRHGFRTCLYCGCDTTEEVKDLIPLLDYLKIGSFKQELGGLDSKNTNQRYYYIKGGKLIDKTRMFQKWTRGES